jgi:hypothetical protein
MQNEVEALITKFVEKSSNKYGSDSYAAGYFGSMLVTLTDDDPALRDRIVHWLTLEMEVK